MSQLRRNSLLYHATHQHLSITQCHEYVCFTSDSSSEPQLFPWGFASCCVSPSHATVRRVNVCSNNMSTADLLLSSSAQDLWPTHVAASALQCPSRRYGTLVSPNTGRETVRLLSSSWSRAALHVRVLSLWPEGAALFSVHG